MWIARVDSPAFDEFIAIGKTKAEALTELINAYKDFYNFNETQLKEEHEYDDFKTYLEDYLGVVYYELSVGEAVVRGYEVYYKNGKRIKR